jgi:hypothetical protein
MSLLETGNESMCYPTPVAVSRFGVHPGQYRFSDLTDHQRRYPATLSSHDTSRANLRTISIPFQA